MNPSITTRAQDVHGGKRHAIERVRRAVARAMSRRMSGDLFIELLRSITSTDAPLLREVLLEIEALRARLEQEPVEALLAARREVGADDVAAGRGVLLLAGFEPEELPDDAVREILEYAPILAELGREAQRG